MKTAIAFLILAGTAFGQQPAAVTAAINKWRTAQASAQRRYDSTMKEAGQKLTRSIGVAMREATKAGNLDLAVSLKKLHAKYSALSNDPPMLDLPAGNPFVGTWSIRKADRPITATLTISRDGSVVKREGKRDYKGKIVRRGRDVFIDFGDRDNDRVTVVRDRIFLEHWRGGVSGFADAIATGYRVKK